MLLDIFEHANDGEILAEVRRVLSSAETAWEFKPVRVSIVVPVYRNHDTLKELIRRVEGALRECHSPFEFVFVDDASPDESLVLLKELEQSDSRVTVIPLESNVGQNRAVLEGLGRARGEAIVVMDAGLHDPPEAIPILLGLLEGNHAAVFAGRSGRHESVGRLTTSRLFKTVLSLRTGLPRDAGIFVAMDREMCDRLKATAEPKPFIVAMIGCTGLPVTSIPIVRSVRPSGKSAYLLKDRSGVGLGALWRVSRWKKELSSTAVPVYSVDPAALRVTTEARLRRARDKPRARGN